MYGARSPTRTPSGASTASASTGSSPTPRSRTPASSPARSRSNGSRTAHQRRVQLRRPAPREARRPDRDHLGRRRPKDDQARSPTASCTRGLPDGQRAQGRGVKKGDRVTIYMPMIPEAAYAMLACARIGAVHSVVFGGFSPDSLAGRIEDCEVEPSSSPPTRACAAAARCRSRPTSTRPPSDAGIVDRHGRGAPHRRRRST